MEKQNYKLSKDAIKRLDNIKIQKKAQISIKSIIIKSDFIFQIEKVKNIEKGLFSATLIDNQFKSDRFILNFEKEDIIPKKGDIINIGQIEKSYKKEEKIYIYKCTKITFIAKELNFITDISKIENYDNRINKDKIIVEKQNKEKNNNINILNKEKNYNCKVSEMNEEKEDEEEEDEDDDDFYNFNNNENKKDCNNNNKIIINNFEEEKINEINNKNNNKIFQNDKFIIEGNKYGNSNDNKKESIIYKYLLISDLNTNSKNFTIYIKCFKKDEIKDSRNKGNKKKYQNYIFYDINNDKIEAVAFDETAKKFDKIVKINEIYQISNCCLILNRNNYKTIDTPFKLLFSENTGIFNITYQDYIRNQFKEMKDNNDIIDNDQIASISSILDKKFFDVINIVGFVLKDYGNTKYFDKYNNEYYGRNILLGDDSNYKVNVFLWHPNDLKEKYNEGELLYIQNLIIKPFNFKKNLYGTKNRKIKNSYNTEYDSKLKNYYSNHNNISEYLEIKIDKENYFDKKNTFNYFNNKTFIKIIFIKDIIKLLTENSGEGQDIRFKVSAVVKKINHSEKNYYYGCNACKKKMLSDVCQNCGNKKKIIILHYSIQVEDCSSSFWLLLFGEKAENFLGIKGEEYKNILEKGISKDNVELNLLNEKVINKEYIFMGKSQFYSYSKYKGFRFLVHYFAKKTKKQYYGLVYYLKYLLK